MRLKRGVTTVLVLALVLAGAARAEAMRLGRHAGPAGILGPRLHTLKTLMELDLSDSQKTRILSLIQEYERDREALEEELVEARHALANAMRAEVMDEDEIRSAFRQVSEVREELLLLGARTRAKLETILTSEQRQLLEERRAERMEKRQRRHRPVCENGNG
jgi:Spy/CpxP family protein refolding chaperone